MKTHTLGWSAAALIAGAGVTVGCAGWDNPTALADLEPEVEFDIEAAEVQTFEEVEIHVHVTEAGARLPMEHSELEIRHGASGETRTVDMAPEGDGYAVHVTFFEPGEHHIHFNGTPERHSISAELGEVEIDVARRHELIGPYWVEIEVSPAPQPGVDGHVHVLVYDGAGGVKGAPIGALDLHLEIHNPDGSESTLAVAEEEAGEYEAEFTFGDPGEYELHVEIETGTGSVEGAFHIPLLAEPDTDADAEHDEEGDGHDHG